MHGSRNRMDYLFDDILSFAHKSVRALEHFFEQRVKAQSDDELFRYMLERHWEPWARSKGIHKK